MTLGIMKRTEEEFLAWLGTERVLNDNYTSPWTTITSPHPGMG